jgi:hypothetical protein
VTIILKWMGIIASRKTVVWVSGLVGGLRSVEREVLTVRTRGRRRWSRDWESAGGWRSVTVLIGALCWVVICNIVEVTHIILVSQIVWSGG